MVLNLKLSLSFLLLWLLIIAFAHGGGEDECLKALSPAEICTSHPDLLLNRALQMIKDLEAGIDRFCFMSMFKSLLSNYSNSVCSLINLITLHRFRIDTTYSHHFNVSDQSRFTTCLLQPLHAPCHIISSVRVQELDVSPSSQGWSVCNKCGLDLRQREFQIYAPASDHKARPDRQVLDDGSIDMSWSSWGEFFWRRSNDQYRARIKSAQDETGYLIQPHEVSTNSIEF